MEEGNGTGEGRETGKPNVVTNLPREASRRNPLRDLEDRQQ